MLYLTHDIDWLNPQHPISVAKTCLGKPWLSLKQLMQHDVLLKHIETIIKTEKQHHIQAIYLIGVQSVLNTYSRYGIRYSFKSALLKELISLLKSADLSIGLHVNHTETITWQLEQFEKLTGTTPKYIRNHYFHTNDAQNLTLLRAKGVTIDFSLGNPLTVGYTQPDPNAIITQVPTILSDNNYIRLKNDSYIHQSFRDTLARIQAENLDGSILFHPENLLIYPQLNPHFENVISLMSQTPKA